MKVIWALALVLTLSLPAQNPPPVPPASAQEQVVIKDIVDLVNVLVTVKDRKGRLISTLDKKDFEVNEDGRAQEVRYFARETDLPLTIGMLVDTSPSLGRLIPEEQQAGLVFLDSVLKAKDLAFLISFDSDVDLLQDYTATRSLLRAGLGRLRVGGGGGAGGGPFPSQRTGGTHLYDAVFLAATEKLSREVGRKTVVVLTDGEDQGSRVKLEAAIEAAQKADVIIYGVLVVDREFYGRYSMMSAGDGVLRRMCEETGGRMIRADRPKDLAKAFADLAEELRSQYSLAYSSTNPKKDGSFRKLTVKVTQPDMKVQARKGYYAIPPGT